MPSVVRTAAEPAVEPLTLDEAKVHLRMGTDPHPEDGLVTRLITAARRYCEVLGKVVFVHTTFDLVDDTFPQAGGYLSRQSRQFFGQFAFDGRSVYPGLAAYQVGEIRLPRAPLASVTSVSYLDPNGQLQVLDPSHYAVVTGAPGRVAPVFGKVWPVCLPQIGAVTVRFVAGYGPDADAVPANCKAATLLMLGHLYENREAVLAGVTPARLPLGIEHLLGTEPNSGGYA